MIFKITLFLLLNHGVTEFTYSSEGATQIGNGLATDLVIRDIPEGREIRLNPIPNLTVSFKFSKFNNTVFYQERHGNDFDEFYVTLSPFQPKLFNLTVVATFWDGNKNHKTFSYAGFEQQPKAIESPRIALLNVELELKSEHTDAEVRVNPGDFQAVVDAEWKILQDKLDLIADSGANVVLSCLPIGDLATQYFAEKKIFCAGRVPDKELKNMAKLSGGAIQTSLRGLKDKNAVGVCDHFEERQVGNERMNFFRKVIGKNSRGKHFSTIILRGGAEQYIEESSRSLNDAIMVLKNVVAQSKVVAGAGAAEMELSRALKQHARSLHSADSFFVAAFARALEAIPSALAANAGLDSTDILNELRFKHHSKNFCGRYFGVDIEREGTGDARKAFVWEPLEAKLNMVQAATEAACLILTVDDTVKAPKEEHAAQRMAQ